MEKIYDVEEILSRLKFFLKLKTWKEVAAYLGEKEGTLSAWKKNNRQSCVHKILYVCRGKLSDSWLLTGEGPMLENAGEMTQPKPTISRSATSTPLEPPNVAPAPPNRYQPNLVPLISWVQAGDWQFVADPFQPGDADEWLDTTATRSEHAFALSVRCDSMEPEFTDGDIIIVDPERDPVSGSYIVAKNGAEATFKQLVMDGQSVFLKPLNERYPIRDMTGIEFRIVGVVVEKRKRY
jgi:SOS-response transcriptional repressor LexA